VGQEYYRQCLSMMAGAEAAQAVIDRMRSEPQGVVKITCPPGLTHYLFGRSIADFMACYPRARVQLKAFNRRVDVIAEGYDIAIRSNASLRDQSGLVVRKLRSVPVVLVGSPGLVADRMPMIPSDLAGLPSLDFGLPQDDHEWRVEHADGASTSIRHQPRFVSDDLSALREAALRGIGIAQLPLPLIEADIAAARLIRLLPEWHSEDESACAVFPSRRGLLPSIRALLDFLSGIPTRV
jgi:DNA-binding transcriptional LysR family regulator